MLRGDGLEDSNVLDFFVETYEEDIKESKNTTSHWGRHRNDRIAYLHQHWKSGKKTRVKRCAGHRNLPNIIGPWFPHQDNVDGYGFYCASMLVLLKPWHHIRNDLKRDDQSWQEAFDEFLSHHVEKENLRFILSGIQFFHDCNSAAELDTEEESVGDGMAPSEQDVEERGEVLHDDIDEAIHQIEEAQTSWPERLHAQAAVDIARLCGLFCHEMSTGWVVGQEDAIYATDEEMSKLKSWRDELQIKLAKKDDNNMSVLSMAGTSNVNPTVECLNQALFKDQQSPHLTSRQEENMLSTISPSALNDDQV